MFPRNDVMPLLGGKNKFKVDPPRIRIEKVAVERPKPKPKPNPQPSLAHVSQVSPSPSLHRPSPKPVSRQQSYSPYPSSSDERRLERKRKVVGAASQQRSPAVEHVTFDKDSDNEDDGWMHLEGRKRQRKSPPKGKPTNTTRKLKHPRAYRERDPDLQFIHATDVASLESKCVPVMGASMEDVAIELQYPSLQCRER